MTLGHNNVLLAKLPTQASSSDYQGPSEPGFPHLQTPITHLQTDAHAELSAFLCSDSGSKTASSGRVPPAPGSALARGIHQKMPAPPGSVRCWPSDAWLHVPRSGQTVGPSLQAGATNPLYDILEETSTEKNLVEKSALISECHVLKE